MDSKGLQKWECPRRTVAKAESRRPAKNSRLPSMQHTRHNTDVLYFSVPHFPALHFLILVFDFSSSGPVFSSPTFSCPAFYSLDIVILQIPVLYFPVLLSVVQDSPSGVNQFLECFCG